MDAARAGIYALQNEHATQLECYNILVALKLSGDFTSGNHIMKTAAEVNAPARLMIEVWADVVCPWCYLGEQRLSTAIERSLHRDHIDLKIHTFQLDPDADTSVVPIQTYLAKKFGLVETQTRAMEEEMARRMAGEGLQYALDRPAGNTLDMLRLVHLGAAYGVGWEYMRAMQNEVFSGNYRAFEQDTLLQLGEQLGLPTGEIRDVLATDRYKAAVLTDHNQALNLGARGVPFTVLGRRLGIPGAVSTDQYAAGIDQAWEEQSNG